MLWTKFENPMLGIYAGLLHLRLKKIDPGLLREVVANLVGLVGPLPDVLALGWGLSVRDQTFREDVLFKASLDRPGDLATPPMLRASWDHLLEATTLRPDLVPRGSFSDRVAPQIVSGGPWLSWRGEVPSAPTEQTPIETTFTTREIPGWLQAWGLTPSLVDDLAQGTLVVGLPMLSKLLKRRPDAADQLYSKRFTDLERRVAQYVYPLVDPQLRELAEASPGLREKLKASADERSSDPAELVRSLKVPAGTALGAVWGLIRKLEIQPVLPATPQLKQFVAIEAHRDPTLKGVLERIGKTPTQLHHQRSRRPVNGLEFLYLCYQGSPAEFSLERPKAARLAEVLNEAEFVVGPEEKPVTGRTIGSILGELRKTTVQVAEPAVEAGELHPAPGWQEHVLPRPSRYREGELFAALKPSSSRELLPEL
jgi:hypothetical protein